MRLLVAEDEADLADAIARGLRRHGYAVDVAGGAMTAEEKLRGKIGKKEDAQLVKASISEIGGLN